MELVYDETQGNEQCYYLPHHAVLKPSSTSTKLRMVFNASQRKSNGRSLNDHLHTGPKLQNDVPTVIMKWRVYNFVFSTDIEKMYRQISVDPKDTNLQRISWRSEPSEPIRCYRLHTVKYGTACAPYLACRTLQQLWDDYEFQFPLGASILRNNFYVDDALFGAFDHSTSLLARNELRSLLQHGGLKLRKWLSNSPELLVDIPEEDIESADFVRVVTDEQFKTLGIYWNPTLDTFTYQVHIPPAGIITKRSVLADISRLYDPLGWLAPATITAKIFLQKLWLAKLEWDDVFPPDLLHIWLEYRQGLEYLNTVTINRWIGTTESNQALELNGFCDASLSAYGAVVHLRIIHGLGQAQVSLVAAKTKVSPLKTISIPRLELCGATLLAQLLSSVQKSLTLKSASIYSWSDSTIVLAWLEDHPSRWKTFISNRVSLIHERLPNAIWNHVPSHHNPGDYISGGVAPSGLKRHHVWWSGPRWLKGHSTEWPKYIPKSLRGSDLEEKRETYTHIILTSYSRMIRRST